MTRQLEMESSQFSSTSPIRHGGVSMINSGVGLNVTATSMVNHFLFLFLGIKSDFNLECIYSFIEGS